MGEVNILKRAYMVLCNGAADRRIRSSLCLSTLFRITQFIAGARTEYGRDRLAGARAAYRVLPELLGSHPHCWIKSISSFDRDA